MSSVDSWSPVAPIPDVLGCAYGHLPSLPAQCAPVRGTLAAACRFHPDRNGTAPKFPSPSETVRLCRQGTLEASSNPRRVTSSAASAHAASTLLPAIILGCAPVRQCSTPICLYSC